MKTKLTVAYEMHPFTANRLTFLLALRISQVNISSEHFKWTFQVNIPSELTKLAAQARHSKR